MKQRQMHYRPTRVNHLLQELLIHLSKLYLIRDYLNHGIHVSGKDILIQENRIYGGLSNGIRISDIFGRDCSENIVIRWNEIDGGSEYGASAIQVLDYKPDTLEIYDNTEYNSAVPVDPVIDRPFVETNPD